MTHPPKRPTSGNWIERAPNPRVPFPHAIFDHVQGVRVMSSVDLIDGSSTPTGQPRNEFHVSISHLGGRASDEIVRQVAQDFGMQGAFEDNHVGRNGVARNLWLPVDQEQQAQCPCEANEPVHDEGGGFKWREAPKGSAAP